ncbi:hypothetical protein BHU72_02025 [Desulfuribacillus stibiiarsenatis]|uniref:Response regulatory domain-containing protein n=1 Tax=Desulfuribacillus stibiiarsenatis TaxID=1390249 RepID=A0A1E5L644_9FIRM|nr:response regulator [Desulfuribacillus stibiiarsenatis]OEH85600.1 hypothetical protein BHU72_02025 [Desulfuribacillus stibiiarsenatis]
MKKIAVIDDNKTFRHFVKQILEQSNYHVEEFVNADEFFSTEKEIYGYDLILIDYNMPGMNGITALENIKFNPVTQGVPVLLVTGEPERKVVDVAVRLKVNDFISKPIDPEFLVERVNKLLRY